MKGTTLGSQAAQQLHTISESAEQVSSDIAKKANQFLESEPAKKATQWMQQNGKSLGWIGAVAVAGVLGYVVGRNFKPLSQD